MRRVCNTRSYSPLAHETIVQNTVLLVGPGQYLYVSSIAKLWLRCYQSSFRGKRNRRQLLINLTGTAWQAAFTSVSQLKMARAHRLPQLIKPVRKANWQKSIQYVLGQCADLDTLMCAFDMGAQRGNSDLFLGAVSSGDALKVQYLLQSAKDRLPPQWCGAEACTAGALAVLQLLLEAGHVDDADVLQAAAASGVLEILEMLHSRRRTVPFSGEETVHMIRAAVIT